MACCCGGFCGAADAQFSRERAEKELRQYHRKGPKSTTRLLRDGSNEPASRKTRR